MFSFLEVRNGSALCGVAYVQPLWNMQLLLLVDVVEEEA